MDPDFVDFVKKLVMINPSERITIQEAAKHPFITKGGELGPVDISIVYSGSEDKS